MKTHYFFTPSLSFIFRRVYTFIHLLKSELESTFAEIINTKMSNIVVGVIYRHPFMDVTDFNQNYLNRLLDKISKEEKKISSW